MANDIAVTPITSLPRSHFTHPAFAPPPYLVTWRCNLTALSHTENLYFVAGRSEIFVYQPNFPDQRLDSDPTLILQPSGPEHAQPIVHEAPLGPGRYINQLIVDFLGNEEILLLALHNGGVIGYRISQIQQAIEKRQEPDCVETNVGDDVTPFFREHVEKSAWGLAVHREARMIAVSSNTHKVTVFAFALDRRDAPSSGPWYRDRSSQRKVQLPNTGTNIPCVAFCNTADDPEGRWLMTTDIEGVARIFDLALIGSVLDPCVHMTAPRFCVQACYGDDLDCICPSLDEHSHQYCHATWGALWLDSRAFKRVDNLKEAFGCEAKITKSSTDQVCFDCSKRRSLVPNSSTTWRLDPSAPPEEPEDGFWDRGLQCWRELTNEFENEIPESEGLPSTSPIMLLSIRDMILLQPLKSGIESDHVAYHDPLFQTCREGEDALWLLDQDRLNLHAQIPELGVVIVGSAKGRVAVLSLTQTSSTRPGGKTYACRIDHILPTLEQERRGQRSVGSLAGIAVGPIQGMLGRAADHPRRWRLLMMYHDNEVLKYEISKRTDGELRAQEVSELII
ncbi:uncharacterized protein J3D65DRAFT_675946 [Phyllosticta citribraziliensis]|uniref:Uncharacterized protein n=1 Tax=Phyllosticta citribraziliensis TaxID=989973 RepID=A0ABR1LXI4_9PEZI